MRFLVTLPPAWSTDYPYLGTAIITSSLKLNGFDAKFFDLNLEMYLKIEAPHQEYWDHSKANLWMNKENFSESINPKISNLINIFHQEIKSYRPDFIAFTVLCSNYLVTLKLIKWLRVFHPNTKIICGGPEISKEKALQLVERGDIDAGFFSDGEESLIAYLKNRDPDMIIPGVVYKSNGKLLVGEKKYANLNLSPYPDFSDLNLSSYTSPRKVPISFSRGCIARCDFCSESRYVDQFRFRSSERVISEIKQSIQKYKTTEFHCIDSLVNGNLKLLKQICTSIISNNIQIEWGGLARFSGTLTESVIKLMYESGCRYLSFGLESGSQFVLNLMRKDVNIDDVYRIIPLLNKNGIEVHVSIIVGYPGEEECHFQETLTFLDDYHDCLTHVSFAQPLSLAPKSYLFDHYKELDIEILPDLNWRLKDMSNTPEIRNERHAKLLQKISKYNLNSSGVASMR